MKRMFAWVVLVGLGPLFVGAIVVGAAFLVYGAIHGESWMRLFLLLVIAPMGTTLALSWAIGVLERPGV